jgi:putative secretion ATPase (PEP-CTERM system associated)
MYTSFFGFTCKPFQLTPDPEFLFLSRVHKRALTYLNYGISENFGFILVTGEIGTGKTTIMRTLLKQVPQEIRIARVNNTKVTSEQLISMINEDFGIDTKGKDKTQLLSELADFLIRLYGERKRAVLIIDEAQNLSPDLLEEIRLLSNLETDKSKLLQIVLIGQPELNSTLSRVELEQLRQRIAFRTHISPLSREETEAYIRHRLRVAGNENGVSFEEGVMDAIYDFSKGTPRLINVLCEFSLLAVFVDEKRSQPCQGSDQRSNLREARRGYLLVD